MDNSLNQKFDTLLSKYISIIEKSLQQRLRKAKNKEFVALEITKEIALVNEMIIHNDVVDAMLDLFRKDYLRGNDLSITIAYIIKRYGTDVEEIMPFKRMEEGKKITLYISEEERELKKLATDERKLIRFLVRYIAYLEIDKRLPDLLKIDAIPETGSIANLYPIQWTGSKDNKNEFVQLIYALHEAGYLNKGRGEITKVVERLAETLQVGLGKNWQSNHSASIHKANKDYQPPIFDKIRQSYFKYSDELITAKKTNK